MTQMQRRRQGGLKCNSTPWCHPRATAALHRTRLPTAWPWLLYRLGICTKVLPGSGHIRSAALVDIHLALHCRVCLSLNPSSPTLLYSDTHAWPAHTYPAIALTQVGPKTRRDVVSHTTLDRALHRLQGMGCGVSSCQVARLGCLLHRPRQAPTTTLPLLHTTTNTRPSLLRAK